MVHRIETIKSELNEDANSILMLNIKSIVETFAAFKNKDYNDFVGATIHTKVTIDKQTAQIKLDNTSIKSLDVIYVKSKDEGSHLVCVNRFLDNLYFQSPFTHNQVIEVLPLTKSIGSALREIILLSKPLLSGTLVANQLL